MNAWNDNNPIKYFRLHPFVHVYHGLLDLRKIINRTHFYRLVIYLKNLFPVTESVSFFLNLRVHYLIAFSKDAIPWGSIKVIQSVL
jgi:hypothetical protein